LTRQQSSLVAVSIVEMTPFQQRYRPSGLNLVTAAVVLWNTVYL
jgi:TnpA family transposase